MRGASDASATAAAALLQRLSILLAAGLPPSSAWAHALAAGSSATVGARTGARAGAASVDELQRLREGLGDGLDPDEALQELVDSLSGTARARWAAVLAAWRVALLSGAPLAATLARLAEVERAGVQTARRIETALAGPTATARIVLALPLVGILFGVAMGFDVLGTLVTTPAGLACLGVGLALLASAVAWNRRLLATARRRQPAPGLDAELMAIALEGGGSTSRARVVVDAALRTNGLEATGETVAAVLRFAEEAGVPAAALLRSEAEEARREAESASDRAAAVLAVKLMLPLGVCLLPSFLALCVVPMILALVGSTGVVP